MNTLTLEVSTEEVKVLVQALDLATKGGGLQAAQVTLPIAVKLQMALDNEEGAQKAAEKTGVEVLVKK